ncbi:cytochrome oxidase subunit III [Marivirga lumbricoides]|uniref:Cytochrome oxidase subunit III n=1 Tax=Marivirga lumbricoides TaxID=1046115 RepID=A0ABQ1MK11_9BACT|nr:cytochrome oxidase subunit III [Marivirga lumbricoides]
MAEKKTKNEQLTFFEKVERMHPYKMMLILGIVGSSLIFFFLLFSFFVSLDNTETSTIQIPAVFVLSSVLIIASSFILHPAMKYFKQEAIPALLTSLRFTFLLGLGFAFCQLIGWTELKASGILLTTNVSGSFLYVLTALHGLHFIVVHTYLGFLIFQTRSISKDPVKLLIAETNPFWHLKYELLTKAWHFLGVLWMILIISFWVFL